MKGRQEVIGHYNIPEPRLLYSLLLSRLWNDGLGLDILSERTYRRSFVEAIACRTDPTLHELHGTTGLVS